MCRFAGRIKCKSRHGCEQPLLKGLCKTCGLQLRLLTTALLGEEDREELDDEKRKGCLKKNLAKSA